MTRYPFVDLRLANKPLETELKAATAAVIESGRYLHGEQTALLEEEIANLCEAKHCLATSNGLDALRLILRAYIEMRVMQPGDKVIVPADTYIASVLAITDNRLEPSFIDIDPVTMNLDSNLLESLITPRVKAIMPVHLYGTPCCDNTMLDVARRYGLKIIEDNAQAIGAKAALNGINGTRTTGGLGDAAGISFYPTKNLGALGDAGAVVTNDDDLAATVRALANYGSDRRYHNIYCGLNCRIDEIQAAMLRVKLRHLPQENKRRQAIAAAYNEAITNPLVATPAIIDNMRQVWHQYVIRCTRRDRLRTFLHDNGIGTDIHYATPPHLQPCYSQYSDLELPQTVLLASTAVSLPIAYPIKPDDARAIAAVINRFS